MLFRKSERFARGYMAYSPQTRVPRHLTPQNGSVERPMRFLLTSNYLRVALQQSAPSFDLRVKFECSGLASWGVDV
jgi:hypothetical protein